MNLRLQNTSLIDTHTKKIAFLATRKELGKSNFKCYFLKLRKLKKKKRNISKKDV